MQQRTMEKENRNKSERQLRSRIGKPQQKNHELQQKNRLQQKNHGPQHRLELHHQLNRNISDRQLNNDEEPQQNSNRSGETSQNSHSNMQQTLEQFPAAELNKVDRNLLKKFRNKMDNIKHVICPVCNESCPSIVLVNGKCRWCHSKKMSNRFSEENNMDPGEVPEELQDLTEIEEMLIAKAFTVMSVYRLRGGQYGYRGNVINFPQDVHELATRLPRHPLSLEILIVQRHSVSDLAAFRDFTVRHAKVARALQWLKANNRYYKDIIIDEKVLQSLPENRSIADQLPQIENDQINGSNEDENGNDNMIARTFVLSLPLSHREDLAISSTLDRIQTKNPPITWSQIDNSPINEF